MLNNLIYASLLLMVLVSVPFWRVAVLRLMSGRELLPIRKTVPSPLGFADVILVFLFWYGAQVAASLGFLNLFDLELESLRAASDSQLAWFRIFTAGAGLIGVAVALAVVGLRYRRLDSIGWQSRFVLEDILIGVQSFVMVVPTVLIVQVLLTQIFKYNHSTLEAILESPTGLTIGASWMAAGVVAPICEEVIYRGIFQGWMQRLGRGSSASVDDKIAGGWGDAERQTLGLPMRPVLTQKDSPSEKRTRIIYWPMFVTAACFAAMHIGQGPAPIPIFILGLALGYVFRQTGSVLGCVICHMLLNVYTLFWTTIGVFYVSTEIETATGWIQWTGCSGFFN